MDDIQVFQFICAAFTIYLYKFPLFFSSPILPLVPSMLVSLPRHPSLHILQHLFSLVLTLLCESFGGPLVAMSGAPSFFVWLKVTEPTTKKVVQFCSATFPVRPAPPHPFGQTRSMVLKFMQTCYSFKVYRVFAIAALLEHQKHQICHNRCLKCVSSFWYQLCANIQQPQNSQPVMAPNDFLSCLPQVQQDQILCLVSLSLTQYIKNIWMFEWLKWQ